MIIKRALENLATRISTQESLANKVLMPLLLLSSLKNYLFSCQGKTPFSVPDDISSRTLNRADRIVLVLDMDETLIYSRGDQRPKHNNYFEVKNGKQHYFVENRPHLTEFLEAASKVFILYIYTAGKKQYADSIINHIDPKGLIEKRFYRDSCVTRNGVLLKNLNRIRILPNRMVLLDDNPDSIALNHPHSLLCPSFQGNQRDSQLPRLFQDLLKFYQ